MSGRTLNDAYINLDEAQNCTVEQMKMFLTRFGEGSRVVVTGDITQIDLPREKTSGLIHALRVLNDVEGLSIVYLTARDVVRHEMVQRIVRAYEKAAERAAECAAERAAAVRDGEQVNDGEHSRSGSRSERDDGFRPAKR